MGDRDNLVLLGFEGRFNLVQGDNAPEFGFQRVHLGAIRLQARVEESVPIKETKPPNTDAPIGKGVTEVTSIQN